MTTSPVTSPALAPIDDSTTLLKVLACVKKLERQMASLDEPDYPVISIFEPHSDGTKAKKVDAFFQMSILGDTTYLREQFNQACRDVMIAHMRDHTGSELLKWGQVHPKDANLMARQAASILRPQDQVWKVLHTTSRYWPLQAQIQAKWSSKTSNKRKQLRLQAFNAAEEAKREAAELAESGRPTKRSKGSSSSKKKPSTAPAAAPLATAAPTDAPTDASTAAAAAALLE